MRGHNVSLETLSDYHAPRRCFREPIAEILNAASLLSEAADAHLAGNKARADERLRAADMPAVRAWTDSLWGSAKRNPDLPHYIRYRAVPDAPPSLPKAERIPARMPTAAQRKLILGRYGRHCTFCGIPLISPQVRDEFRRHYPEAAYWGSTNAACHAAFQCMWLQFDHVLPHARGGDNSLENVVPTCAGCNYGRASMTLEEVGLLDPRTRPPKQAEWDGLERILRRPA